MSMEARRPIFLTGLPGSGKTTLGRALARLTGLQHIDLDLYIQARFSCSVSDIFARQGEERFRQIEHNLLHEVAEMQDVVVSCGGGTPCFFDNMDYMLSRGTVLYLEADRDRLLDRLWRGRARRPAIASLDREGIALWAARTLEQRAPVYARAHLRVESSSLEDRESIRLTAERTASALGLSPAQTSPASPTRPTPERQTLKH